MFYLKYKAHFDAAHLLGGYKGLCSQLHGHRWEVELEYEAEHLNNDGMVVDFNELKRIVMGELPDHTYLNDWMTARPTAENLAYTFFGMFTAYKASWPNAKLVAVTVWESPNACIRYAQSRET